MNFEAFSQKVTELTELASGWRGIVYTALYNGKKIAIKIPNRDEVMHTTESEVENIGYIKDADFIPKLITKGEDFFAYSFIEGKHLDKVIRELKKSGDVETYKKILTQMLNQLYYLDTIGFFKKELIRCTKNFIVNDDYHVFMIDFERSKCDVYNKNIPQFLQFLKGKHVFDFETTIELGKLYGENREMVLERIKEGIMGLEENF